MAYAPSRTPPSRTPTRSPGTRARGGSANGKTAPGRPSGPLGRSPMSLVAGLVIGLALGAAAALLLAPHSGRETRQAIRNRGKRVRNKASDAWEDLRLELAR